VVTPRLVLFAAIFVIAGVFASVPDAAQATVSGANGRVVYERLAGPGESGVGPIYVVNADGSHRVQLTHGVQDEDPAWAPDGSAIVYVSGSSTFNLFVIAPDGTGRTNITQSPGTYRCPSWSPDGTKLLFSSGAPISSQIETINPDGTGRTAIGPGDCPSWSPDGTKIAFESDGSIQIMNADGSGVTPIDTGLSHAHSPSWSPDGIRLVFAGFTDPGNYEVFVIGADGSGLTRITTDTAGDIAPTFTPDGASVLTSKDVFAPDSLLGISKIELADPSNVTRITRNYDQHPDMLAAQVRLRSSRSTCLYHRSVRITAHLIGFAGTSNHVVSIYMTPFGGSRRLVDSGNVDSQGNFLAVVRLAKNTVFEARWTGDVDRPAGGWSTPVGVGVFPRVTGTLVHPYATAGAYRLYHFTRACPDAGTGCPTYAFAVAPNHAGRIVRITLQLYRRGAWRTALSFDARLNAHSKGIVAFQYPGPGVIGVPSRVRTRFPHDGDHLTRDSAWSYFRVTV